MDHHQEAKASPLQRLLSSVIDVAREAVVVTDHAREGDPIIYVNEAFLTVTGYQAHEVMGRSCSFLQGGDVQQPALAALSQALRDGVAHETVLRNYRKDGRPFLNRLSLTPIWESDRVAYYCGFLSDVTEQQANADALRASDERWRTMFEKMNEGFYIGRAIRDPAGHMVDFRTVEVNSAVERLLGLDNEAVMGRTGRTLAPSICDRLVEEYRVVLRSGISATFEVQLPLPDARWFEVRAHKVDEDHFSVLFVDITLRKNAQLALAASEDRFRTFAQAVPSLIWVKPVGAPVDWYNDRVSQVTGRAVGDLAGRRWLEIVHPDDVSRVKLAWQVAVEKAEPYQLELRVRDAAGRYHWFLMRTEPVRDDTGKVVRWIGIGTDIDVQQREAARLAYLSTRDMLTGLLNRYRVIECLAETVEHPPCALGNLAVVFIDLDRFKQINDVYGHGVGDQVLCEVARRFSGVLEPGNRLARIGGDEFLFLAIDDGADRLPLLIDRILQAARAEIAVKGATVLLTASVGVASYPGAGTTAETLIGNAGIAMFQAKLAGGGAYRIFSPAMAEHQLERLQISNDLRQAIGRCEMRLFYQPIFSLATGVLIGAEALMRWQHPVRGLLGADQFIGIAEQSQSIVALGRWALEQACQQLREWDDLQRVLPRITVNLTARELIDERMPAFFTELLDRYELEPGRIGVEVTESMIMSDVEKAVQVLGAIHEMGISISIDDFGTGFSNIAALQNFSFDALKIDKSFVKGIGRDPESRSAKLTQAVIAMSRALGLKTVAEGVETCEQLDFLRANGCDAVQGYLFSAAVSAETFVGEFLGTVGSPDKRKLPI